MDVKDTEKLFNLFRSFFPNAKQLDSKPTQRAWVAALEPYNSDDVVAAAIAYFQKNKFFPDLADITAGLKQEKKEKQDAENISWMKPYIIKNFSRRSVEHADRYHAAGVPTYPEATDKGISFGGWMEMCRKAGL